MPDFAEIALRLVGAFYVFAGVVATRAGLMSRLLDRSIAAIDLGSGKGSGANVAEERRTTWLIAASALVFVAGVALLVLAAEAVWLFLASAVSQAIYLFALAPFYFDKAEAPDATGRRQTTNAAVIYMFATAFVLWAAATGRLVPFAELQPAVQVAAAAAVVAYAVYLLRNLLR